MGEAALRFEYLNHENLSSILKKKKNKTNTSNLVPHHFKFTSMLLIQTPADLARSWDYATRRLDFVHWDCPRPVGRSQGSFLLLLPPVPFAPFDFNLLNK